MPSRMVSPVLHHIGVVAHLQCGHGVLFHNDNGDAGILNAPDEFKDLRHQLWHQTQGGLVQDQKLRARHEPASDGYHLLLTAGESVCLLLLALLHTGEQLEDEPQTLFNLSLVPDSVGPHHQIVPYGHLAKQVAAFRNHGNSHVQQLIGLHPHNGLALVGDIAAHHRKGPGDGPQQRGLSGTV